MSKPLGVNQFMQVVQPTKTEDAVYDAVEKAVAENLLIREFMAIVREAWEYEFDQQHKARLQELRTAMKE